MTISSTTTKVSYNGSGSVGPFSITFRFAKNADIEATKVSTAGVESTLALTTHYTLTGAGDPSGGTLTLVTALATGEKLVIKRSPAIVQETDYVENAAFPAEAHEAALDLLTMIAQSLQEEIGRAVKVQVSSTTSPDDLLSELAADVAAAAASATTATTQVGLAEDAKDAAVVAQGLAEAAAASIPTFGTFGLTLAGTTTASNARAALDLGSAATLDAGTDPGDVLQLDESGRIPAVSGALLTDLPVQPLNGDFASWPRGTSFTDRATSTNTAFYGPELWGFNRGDDVSGLDVSRVAAGMPGMEYACKLQRRSGNTGTELLAAYWVADSKTSLRYAGRTVFVNVWLKKGANYSGGNINLLLSAGTGVDQREYVMTGRSVCGFKTITPTTEFEKHSFSATIPDTATQIGFRLNTSVLSGTAGADDSITIAGFHFGADTNYLAPALTEQLCGQHYKSGTARFSGQGSLTGSHKYWFTLPGLPMRSTPTMGGTPSYTNASSFSWANANIAGAEAAVTISTAGGYVVEAWTADAGF